MDKEIQLLYAKLTQEDRAEVDAQIHMLFVKRAKSLADKNCSGTRQQEAYCIE